MYRTIKPAASRAPWYLSDPRNVSGQATPTSCSAPYGARRA